MKKCTAVILAVLTILSCVCLSSCENTGVNFYKVTDIKEGKIEKIQPLNFLKSYTGSSDAFVCEIKSDAPADVTVPAINEKLPVIGVFSAVDPSNGVRNVKIAKGVKYIEKCFNKCGSLTNIELPSSIESIEDSFIDCPEFKAVEVKGELDVLKNSFVNCGSLSDVKFKGSLENGIEGNIFKGCNGIERMEFEDELSAYKASTDSLDALEELRFKDKVGTIDSYCFSDCKELKSVQFDGDVTTIESGAFSKCSELESVIFNGYVDSINGNAFSDCAELKTVEFKKDADYFGENAFSKCAKLETAKFSGNVKSFGTDSFSECGNLKTVNFNGSINTLGENAFKGSGVESLSFNGKVESIFDGAFSESKSLKNVVFRKKVGTVNDDAFDDCKSLKVTEFKKRVTNFWSGAFSGCKKIIVKNIKDAPNALLNNGTNIGTKLLTDVNDKVNYKKLFNKARKKLGKKLPSSKLISYTSARRLAKKYNGPMFYMMYPAKCNTSKYSTKYAKKAGVRDDGLHTEYIGSIHYGYRNTVFTNKKARKLIKGRAPLVYCIAEQTGYSGPKVYKSINSTRNITRKYYYLNYRFSFWNAKTGKLISWFKYQAGYAPFRYNLSEEGRITRTVDGLGDKRVFLEKDGTFPGCLGYMERFVFGRKKRSNI